MIESNIPPFLKNVSCAVTGHRILGKDFDKDILIRDLGYVRSKGFNVFLCGMALGFDAECFRALEEMRKNDPEIKIAAVVPCADQEERFPEKDAEEHGRMILSADFVARETRDYFRGCMLKRNDFLVDNCSVLYAYYLGRKKSGTYYTMKKAERDKVETLFYGISVSAR